MKKTFKHFTTKKKKKSTQKTVIRDRDATRHVKNK